MTHIESLAIVGATGAVGREACRVIEQRALKVERLLLLASDRGAGTSVTVSGREHRVQLLTPDRLDGIRYALFSAGGDVSRRHAPDAVRRGCVVIDNSSVFRMNADVPLVIPEINAEDAARHHGIIANPNCSTIIMAMAVWPLHRVNPVRRIVVSTYQAASGAGAAAMEELRRQTSDVLAGRDPQPEVFPFPIAFNLFVHHSPLDADGYNTEEVKLVEETRKIFHAPDLGVTATCVRVPVPRVHGEAVNLTFERPMPVDQARALLSAADGVELVDDRASGRFPMPVDAAGRDACLVGHIRPDTTTPDGRGLNLFVCGDQLRKGAALNAIQILEWLAAAHPQ